MHNRHPSASWWKEHCMYCMYGLYLLHYVSLIELQNGTYSKTSSGFRKQIQNSNDIIGWVNGLQIIHWISKYISDFDMDTFYFFLNALHYFVGVLLLHYIIICFTVTDFMACALCLLYLLLYLIGQVWREMEQVQVNIYKVKQVRGISDWCIW